jgi:hypothetical protein
MTQKQKHQEQQPSGFVMAKCLTFALHQRLRCCGHPLCSAGSGDVWRVVWHDVPPELPHSGPPSGPHWSTPLFVPEPPVSCTFCCHPEEYRSGHESTGPVDSPNMSPFCPPVTAGVPLRVTSCFKDQNILCFRLNKQKIFQTANQTTQRRLCGATETA